MSDKNFIENIGETLRIGREAKDMSISAAAMQTHLSASVIEQLEGNGFSKIGAPVFTRGYLIRYARFLGIDHEAITHAFSRLRHEPTELHISKANIASYSCPVRRGRIRSLLTVIVLLVLAGVIAVQAVDPDSWLMQQFNKAFPEKSLQTTTQAFIDQDERVHAEKNDAETIEFQIAPAPATVNTNEQLTLESTRESTGELDDTQTLPDTESPELPVSENNDSPLTSPMPPAAKPTVPVSVAAENIVLHVLGKKNWIEIRTFGNEVVVSRFFEQGESIDLPEKDAPYTINAGRPHELQLSIAGKDEALEQYRVAGSQYKFRIDIN